MLTAMTLRLIYDLGEADLAPLTDLRAAFDVRTGALTTRQRAERTLGGEIVTWVGEVLRGLSGEPPAQQIQAADDVLCVNGRWLEPAAARQLSPGEALVCAEDATLLAARVDGRAALRLLQHHEGLAGARKHEVQGAKVLRRPWDVLGCAKGLLRSDLEAMLEGTSARDIAAHVVGEGRALVHGSARLYPGVVLDIENGPVVIDAEAIIRPNATITGPAYIGRGSQIYDGAVIRAHTSIGPVCKVGGEVGGCIFQACSNKGHGGYLGDSYLGEWVNLGAGTITSNLKNTYGQVRVQQWPGGESENTELTFLGSILGDHVKTAIGTRLLTGTIAHTGAMLALSAFPPRTIDRFAFLTDEGAARYDIDRFLEVAQRVMQRRDVALDEACAARLCELYSDSYRSLSHQAVERNEARRAARSGSPPSEGGAGGG